LDKTRLEQNFQNNPYQNQANGKKSVQNKLIQTITHSEQLFPLKTSYNYSAFRVQV